MLASSSIYLHNFVHIFLVLRLWIWWGLLHPIIA